MDDGAEGGGGDGAAHVDAALIGVGVGEAALLIRLAAENLHHLVRFDGFLKHVHDAAHGLLAAPAHDAQAAAENLHRHGDHRHDGEHHQRQCPVEPEQPDEQRNDGQRVAHENGDGTGGGAGDVADVIGDLRHQHAGRLVIEVARRQAHQAGEHGVTQILDHLVRNPRQRIVGDEAQHAADDEDADDGEGHVPQAVAVAELAVQHRLQQRREERFRAGRDHHAEDGDGKDPPIRPDITEQARIEFTATRRADCLVWHADFRLETKDYR